MAHLDLQNPILLTDMERIRRARTDWEVLAGRRVLITGATGMIASYITLFLIYLHEACGVDVEILATVRSPEKAQARFGAYLGRPYLHILPWDAASAEPPDVDADFIIHAASLASPQFYGRMPVETMLPNLLGTNALLSLMRRRRGQKMLFFSSGSVYGSVTDADVLTEDLSGPLRFLEPGNVYGESKRCGEALCCAYHREYGVPVSIARIHHTYGPAMDCRADQRVFSEFVKNVIDGEDIVMMSDGSARRAFCYLSDTVAALLTVLLSGKAGEVYNVANEREYLSVRELAECVTGLYPEKGLKVVVQRRESNDAYRPSTEKRIVPVSCERLEALGWQPEVSTREGFRRTIEYLLGVEAGGAG